MLNYVIIDHCGKQIWHTTLSTESGNETRKVQQVHRETALTAQKHVTKYSCKAGMQFNGS